MKRWGIALALILTAMAVVTARGLFAPTLPDNIASGLTRSRRVLVLTAHHPKLSIENATPSTQLRSALEQPWATATLELLRSEHIDTILIGESATAPNGSTTERLRQGAQLPGLRAVLLSRSWKVYSLARPLVLQSEYREATGYIARRILAGATTPNATSFPEELRRIHNCEVVVTLREGNQARLWRSAKGSSIARALTTAAVVARQRWLERETTMGESLEHALERMTVDVSLIKEDGSLVSRDDAFLDDMVPQGFGVGFESTGIWRYVLPSDMADKGRPEGRGAVARAFRSLFAAEDMPADSLQKPTLRLYRFTLQSLASSPPQPTHAEGQAELATPRAEQEVPHATEPRQDAQVEQEHARLGG